MNHLILYCILKIERFSSLLFYSAILYLSFRMAALCRIWWESPVEMECWRPYWHTHKRKTTVAAIILAISMLLPTTSEAAVLYVIPIIARSALWDRVFASPSGGEVVEHAKRWVAETVGK